MKFLVSIPLCALLIGTATGCTRSEQAVASPAPGERSDRPSLSTRQAHGLALKARGDSTVYAPFEIGRIAMLMRSKYVGRDSMDILFTEHVSGSQFRAARDAGFVTITPRETESSRHSWGTESSLVWEIQFTPQAAPYVNPSEKSLDGKPLVRIGEYVVGDITGVTKTPEGAKAYYTETFRKTPWFALVNPGDWPSAELRAPRQKTAFFVYDGSSWRLSNVQDGTF